jgi:hypothetical protein
VTRRLVAWYTDYCLNEIDQMSRRRVWFECVYTGISGWAKRKDWKMFKTAMEVVLFENEIPKESPDKQEQ